MVDTYAFPWGKLLKIVLRSCNCPRLFESQCYFWCEISQFCEHLPASLFSSTWDGLPWVRPLHGDRQEGCSCLSWIACTVCLEYPGAEAGSAPASLPAGVHRLCASNWRQKKLPSWWAVVSTASSLMETKLIDETQRERLLTAAIAWRVFLMLLKRRETWKRKKTTSWAYTPCILVCNFFLRD